MHLEAEEYFNKYQGRAQKDFGRNDNRLPFSLCRHNGLAERNEEECG
jgi:hypothetical protein